MAESLGISQQGYDKYEKGVTKRVSADILERFNKISSETSSSSQEDQTHIEMDMTLADVAALVLKNNAMLNVIMSANAEILAKQNGHSVTSVLAEFEAAYSTYLKKIERGELD